MNKYTAMNSPIFIGNTLFRNRLIAGAAEPMFASGGEAWICDEFMQHFVRKANGAGGVVGVGFAFEDHREEGEFTHFIKGDIKIPAYQHKYAELAELIKAEGAVPGIQCMPNPSILDGLDVSDDQWSEYVDGDGSVPVKGKEAPKEVIYEYIRRFGDDALLSKTLGYQMVQIHCAYRNMFAGRFLSPYVNKRTDEFGGSIENRARFLVLMCDEIKKRAGKDMIIHLSITGEEPNYEGGLQLEDTLEFLKIIDGHADIISFRGDQIDVAASPYVVTEELPNRYVNHAAAECIRKDGLQLKLGYISGATSLESMEDLVASGDADFIIASRAYVANEDLGILLREGRGDDVVPCLRCNRCHQNKPNYWHTMCSVNPTFALDQRLPAMTTTVKEKKNIAVIGGGPAGMKCAIELADRGHTVTLYEKNSELGGQLLIAGVPYLKWTIPRFKDYLVHQVEKRDAITVHLNHEVKPGDLDGKYDRVFVAIGAVPAVPPIPGVENALMFDEVLQDLSLLKGNVVVVGGGEIGVELALEACKRGHDSLVIEMKDKLAAECPPIHFRRAFREHWESVENFSYVLNSRVTGIEKNSVTYVDEAGASHTVGADTIIIASGERSLGHEAIKFGSGDQFALLGDCRELGNIGMAMRSAYYAAHTT